jgi:DHA1 family bicyclomycin/chloramphenicol resistance-like MFS transporter
VLYVLAAAACAFAPSIEWLIALRFFQAMGAAAGPVIARAVVRDHYNGREAARVLSLLMLVMGAAPILAPLAGGWVLELASWRAIFGVLAVLGIACLVASSAILPRTAPSQGQVAPPPGTLGRNVRLLLSDRRFVAASLVGAFAQAGLFSYISGSPFVLMGLHHVSPKAFAWIFGMNAMGLIGASQFNRWLLRRYPPARIALTAALGASLLGAALVVLSVTGAGGASALVPTLFLFLASTGLMLPNATALAMEEHGARAGIASALLGSAQYAIAAGASFLVGLLNDGSPRSMAVMMGLSAVGAWVAGGVTTGAVAAREPPEGAPATR